VFGENWEVNNLFIEATGSDYENFLVAENEGPRFPNTHPSYALYSVVAIEIEGATCLLSLDKYAFF